MARRVVGDWHRPCGELPSAEVCEVYGMPFHRVTPEEARARILQRDRDAPFGYVVTPNIDHVVRLHRSEGRLARYYQEAWLCVCDSAVLAFLSRIGGIRLAVTTGSDLVEALLARLDPADRVVVIGCEPRDIEVLSRRYQLREVAHYNPPMGFIDDPAAVQACVDFVVAHPTRFVFLAIGSPQQEIVANQLCRRGATTGLGLCVGSSLRFLSGAEQRAPRVLRGSGFEWLFRLTQDPRRLWKRYLVRGPAIFYIAARCAFGRQKSSWRRADGGLCARLVDGLRRRLGPRWPERAHRRGIGRPR
jgi:N-acetylglucosaminyldiphosphoundecaprenol N-acetyl-beta-D-mannosaminyltransferase